MMKMRVMMKMRRAMMKTRVTMKTKTVRRKAKTARSRAKTVGSRIVQTVMLWTQLMTDSVPLPCPSTPFYRLFMYFYCITRIHAQPVLFKHIYNPCSRKVSRDRYMALILALLHSFLPNMAGAPRPSLNTIPYLLSSIAQKLVRRFH